MAEEKKKSWAETEKPQESVELSEEDKIRAEKLAKFQAAMDTAIIGTYEEQKKTNELLLLILNEMKKANTAIGDVVTEQKDEPVKVSAISPPKDVATTPRPDKTEPIKPTNLEGQKSIEEHYRKQFSTVQAMNGQKITDEQISKMTFAFQESNIMLRNPYLDTPVWAALAAKIDSLGGTYVKGKGAHFLLPYP